jgi:hypothetical protein
VNGIYESWRVMRWFTSSFCLSRTCHLVTHATVRRLGPKNTIKVRRFFGTGLSRHCVA